MASSPGPLTQTSLTDWARVNDLPPAQSTERLWIREEIHGTKWNTAFPYQFMVVEPQGDGSYALLSPNAGMSDPGTWLFTLPIPPESLTISTPFAINTSVTMGGFIEEHNGAPVKMITLQGTTGVFFGREDAPTAPPGIIFAESIFAGNIQSAPDVLSTLTQVLGIVNAVPQSSFDDEADLAKVTGWYQFRLLQYFFEAYAELKKTRDGRRARLAFATWKDEAIYLVAPQSYEFRKAADSPLEYKYSISLKALKRVKLSQGTADKIQSYIPAQKDPGKLAYMLGAIEDARLTVQGAKTTIAAIGGAINDLLFEPLREMSLFVKDALSIPLSVADLPDSLVIDVRPAILELKATKADISDFPTNLSNKFLRKTNTTREADNRVGTLAAEQSGDPFPLPSRTAHPANEIFLNPKDYYEFFSGIKVGDLHLSPHIFARINAERTRVRNLTRADFEVRRDNISASATQYANAIGVGSDTYNSTYAVRAPDKTQVAQPTDEDFAVLYSLNATVVEMNRLVVTNNNESTAKLDAIAAIAGMASRSGIAFTVPKSKFAVPFPYGSTLEMLAYRYLGDPNRWFEIAALNGLQTPYVDETGFDLPLLVNGADNQVLVADAAHLFVGQPVWISSNAVTRARRRVLKIDHLDVNQHLITLDGDLDLERFTTAGDSMLQAFLPNTVNSQQVIYLPSSQKPKASDFKTKSIPGVDEFDQLISVAGVDLLLDQNNDLIVTPDGDTRWAVGLTNIVQKVRLAISVKQGTLNQHPEYGLPIKVGVSIADTDAPDIIRAIQQMFSGDPTFTGVKAAQVNINGPVAKLQIAVEVSGSNQVIPVSVDVNR